MGYLHCLSGRWKVIKNKGVFFVYVWNMGYGAMGSICSASDHCVSNLSLQYYIYKKEKLGRIFDLSFCSYNVPQSSTGVDIGLSDLSCFVKQKMDSGDACNIYSICSVYD